MASSTRSGSTVVSMAARSAIMRLHFQVGPGGSGRPDVGAPVVWLANRTRSLMHGVGRSAAFSSDKHGPAPWFPVCVRPSSAGRCRAAWPTAFPRTLPCMTRRTVRARRSRSAWPRPVTVVSPRASLSARRASSSRSAMHTALGAHPAHAVERVAETALAQTDDAGEPGDRERACPGARARRLRRARRPRAWTPSWGSVQVPWPADSMDAYATAGCEHAGTG